jgi:hypothetical protein
MKWQFSPPYALLLSRRYFWYSLLLQTESTHDRSACSAVLQPTAPPLARFVRWRVEYSKKQLELFDVLLQVVVFMLIILQNQKFAHTNLKSRTITLQTVAICTQLFVIFLYPAVTGFLFGPNIFLITSLSRALVHCF